MESQLGVYLLVHNIHVINLPTPTSHSVRLQVAEREREREGGREKEPSLP
jgi:hypothetical protein